jgi:hypothetical protein
MTAARLIPTLLRPWPRAEEAPGKSDVGDPFECLASTAGPFNAYWARLEADGRVIEPFLALYLEPNEYGSGAAAGGTPGLSRLERVWEEAARAHSRVRSATVAALDARALPENATAQPQRHPPLTYCRRTGAYIGPVCASCLGPLSTCRDEALLRRCGLPSYRSSLTRFLHCPACTNDPTLPSTFYTYSTRPIETVAPGVRVRRRGELYRDLAPKIPRGEETATADHACFSCQHRTTCYPAGRSVDAPIPAESFLFPLAYYDFHCVPLEALALEFDQCAALLGGALWQDRGIGIGPGDGPIGTTDLALPSSARALLDSLRKPLSVDGGQYFFEGDESGLYPLEVLYLKLLTFRGLLQGAMDLYIQGGRPHLALSPERVRGAWSGGAATLPARWGLTLKISDLLSTGPLLQSGGDALDDAGLSDEPTVWALPFPAPEAFLPEEMSHPQSESLTMRVKVRSLQAGSDPRGSSARLEAELTSDLFREDLCGRHDQVRFSLAWGAGPEERILLSGGMAARIPGGFVFAGTGRTPASATASAFDPKKLPGSLSSEVTIHHVFGAPADLTSLGLLLLRLLLQNDGQDGSRLGRPAALRAAEAVAAEAGAAGGNEKPRTGWAQAALSAEGMITGPEQVLYRAVDRKEARPAFPAALWEDVLLLCLRAIANIPEWSLCAAQDDWPHGEPVGPLRRAAEELDALIERARGALLGSSGRSVMIQEVLTDFLTDLKQAQVAGASAPEADATGMTMIMPPRRPRP